MNFQIFTITLFFMISLYIRLTMNVVKLRHKNRLPTGDNNDLKFRNAVRSHANCAEYLPLLMLELYILTQLNINTVIFSVLCLSAILGRALHAYGLNHQEIRVPAIYTGRKYGMILTLLTLTVSAFILLLVGLITTT